MLRSKRTESDPGPPYAGGRIGLSKVELYKQCYQHQWGLKGHVLSSVYSLIHLEDFIMTSLNDSPTHPGPVGIEDWFEWYCSLVSLLSSSDCGFESHSPTKMVSMNFKN